MRLRHHRLAPAVALVGLVLAGCDSQTSVKLDTPAQKASYGIGLNMGKSLAQEGMDDLDSQAVAQGIEDDIGKKERSEERRVGNGCVSKCRSRGSRYH